MVIYQAAGTRFCQAQVEHLACLLLVDKRVLPVRHEERLQHSSESSASYLLSDAAVKIQLHFVHLLAGVSSFA
jgi:hypothetical protein